MLRYTRGIGKPGIRFTVTEMSTLKLGSPGFAVKGGRIWGCERAYARSHPQIRVSTTEFPKEPKIDMRVNPAYNVLISFALDANNQYFQKTM